MIILANSLTTPAIGTVIWTTLIFCLFFFLLAKFAWKPILGMIKAREELIKSSLEAAEKAKEDVAKLHGENEVIMRKAREEREAILKDARDIRDKLIADAKGKAEEEAGKMIEKAKNDIESEKQKALLEINEQVASLSIDIASKLLGAQLSKTGEQEKLIKNYLKEVELNKN